MSLHESLREDRADLSTVYGLCANCNEVAFSSTSPIITSYSWIIEQKSSQHRTNAWKKGLQELSWKRAILFRYMSDWEKTYATLFKRKQMIGFGILYSFSFLQQWHQICWIWFMQCISITTLEWGFFSQWRDGQELMARSVKPTPKQNHANSLL